MLLYKYIPLTWNEKLTDKQEDQFNKRCYDIRNNRFWFAKPDLLNDPYDCKPFFSITQELNDIKTMIETLNDEEVTLVLQKYPNCNSKDDIFQLIKNIANSTSAASGTKNLAIWSVQAMISEIVKAKVANVGVLSFTENPTDVCMWAHYANNHKGVCLEIEIPRNALSLHKIQYTKTQPTFKVHEVMYSKHGRFSDLFYKKSKHWVNESEWRMISTQGNESKEIPKTKVKRILWGIGTSPQTKDKILETINSNISTAQMELKSNYELQIGT